MASEHIISMEKLRDKRFLIDFWTTESIMYGGIGYILGV